MELLIFTDGGSRGNPGPAAIGGVAYVDQKEGMVAYDFSEYLGIGTNNEAEYTALFHALSWLRGYESLADVSNVICHLDSKLVVEQVNKNWKIKEPRMRAFAEKCWEILRNLPCEHKIIYVPRAENSVADSLVNQALDVQAK